MLVTPFFDVYTSSHAQHTIRMLSNHALHISLIAYPFKIQAYIGNLWIDKSSHCYPTVVV